MEDLIEEIVGDIQDEYDEEEDMIIEEATGSYLVHGEADLEEVGEFIGIEFEEEDLENFGTLNGFLISRLEHIPKENETEQIDYCGYKFQIIKVEHKVIRLVRLSRIPNEIEMDQEEKEAFLKEEKRASYFYVDSNFKTPHFRKKGVLRAAQLSVEETVSSSEIISQEKR